MEPKQKARELFDFYYQSFPYAHTVGERAHIAKKGAMRVCEEVLGYVGADRGYEYWTEVKNQIELI